MPTRERARLTEADVREIRKQVADGISQAFLAARYEMTPAAISYIVNYKRWRNV